MDDALSDLSMRIDCLDHLREDSGFLIRVLDDLVEKFVLCRFRVLYSITDPELRLQGRLHECIENPAEAFIVGFKFDFQNVLVAVADKSLPVVLRVKVKFQF